MVRRRMRWFVGALAAVALVLLVWLGVSMPPTTSARPRSVPERVPQRAPAPVDAEAAPGGPPPGALDPLPRDDPRPPIGAPIHLLERLADLRGKLHVRCFVGEEYSPVRGVEDGWFAFNTTERSGMRRVGDLAHGSVRVVRWSAPQGATEVACVPEAPRWGYLTVRALEASGGPAGGVGVIGCGVLQETGEDGRVEMPVLVLDEPCVLDLSRWDGVAVHSQGYVRVAPLRPEETRTVVVRLEDFVVEDGAPSPRFDWDQANDPEAATTGVPPLLPEPTLDDEIDDYEERQASAEAYLDDLQAVLSMTPADERWAVEEAISSTRASLASLAEHLEELDARAEVSPPPAD